MKFIYQPLKRYHKSVTGAVEANCAFILRVESDFDKVSLMLRKEDELLVEYPLCRDGSGVFLVEMKVTTPGLYRYFFKAQSGGETVSYYCGEDMSASVDGDRWVLLAYERNYGEPEWLYGGVMYQIFPDRFNIGGERLKTKKGSIYRDDWDGVPTYKPNAKGIVENRDMFGGNLLGVAEKLDYLSELGVTCIYLNPIFEAASNHKYDTGSYRRVDGDFGGNKQLEILLERAKERGIAVILDGVFSHTGADSVYFNKYGNYDSVGAYQSEDSVYRDWYHFGKTNDDYESWWGINILPNVDENNAHYGEFINGEDGIVRSYIRMGTSGWRLDVADELPDKFLSDLTRAAKREKSDSLVLGEVWENAATKYSYGELRKYLWGGQLDSVTNYPLKNAVLKYVSSANATVIKRTVDRLVNDYPHRNLHLLMNVIDTHDTPRALTSLGDYDRLAEKSDRAVAKCKNPEIAKKKLRLSAVLQYFLPGIPCVYYGDEAGMEGFEDPFNRKCYPWDNQDKELIEFYKALGKIRLCNRDVFARGDYECHLAEDGVFAFTRTGAGRVIAVTVNAGDKPYALDRERTDLISGKSVKSVEPCSAVLYECEIN